MDEVLTMEQINEKFNSEWVLIEQPETAPGPIVLGGRVRYHSKDRDEVDRFVMQLRPKDYAVFYIGEDSNIYAL
jgi:hypothetical protein